MAIIFDERTKTFTLHTEHSTVSDADRCLWCSTYIYTMEERPDGCMDYLLHKQDRGFSGNLHDAGNDRTYSLDVLPQEFPCQGNRRLQKSRR
ncbi:MAG: hypothetical protein ACLTS1_10515 [Coprococcus sp.]